MAEQTRTVAIILRGVSFFVEQGDRENHAKEKRKAVKDDDKHPTQLLPLGEFGRLAASALGFPAGGLAFHREFWNGAAARARRIPSFSMRACSVLRFNPSDAAAFRPPDHPFRCIKCVQDVTPLRLFQGPDFPGGHRHRLKCIPCLHRLWL